MPLFKCFRILQVIACSVVLTLCSTSYCYSQNKTLNLHFEDTESDKEITLRYSILGLANIFYEPYIYKTNTESDILSLSIPDSISSFSMSIDGSKKYKWGKNVNIYMNNHDHLDIYLDTILPPRFSGNNASLHLFMYNLKNGSGNERTIKTLQDFLHDEKYNSFFDFISNEINSNFSSIDSLSRYETVDTSFCRFAKNIVIDDYIFRAGNIASMPDKSYLAKNDSSSFYNDMNKLYETYDINVRDGISLGTKAMLKEIGLIPKIPLDLDLGYKYKSYIYLSRDEQERVVASEIITNSSIGEFDAETLKSRISKYKKTFPSSKFIPVLEQIKVQKNKDFWVARYSSNDGYSEFGRFKTNKLTDLTNMFLGTQYIFVDIWATWCAPCLNEFNFREGLEEFFKENNIGVINVSVDYGGNFENWKKTIINRKIEGLHYLATPEHAMQFPYFKETSAIPRFVLLDKDGTILIDICELPSSGKLIDQIKGVLK